MSRGMKNKHYTLRIDRQVLVVHCTGTWDEQTAIQFCKDFKSAGHKLNYTAWADLVYFDEWEFSVPSVEPIIKDMLRWAQNNNMTHTARIYKAHALKTFQLNNIKNAANPNNNIRQFERASDGFAWLAEHGFNVLSQKVVA